MNRFTTLVRRFATLLTAFAMASGGLASLAGSAQAATAPPWHWAEVTGSAELTWYSSKTVSLQCPAGFMPMSGGFTATDGGLRLKAQGADLSTNQFSFTFGNATPTTQTASINAWCALAADVGTLTTTTVASQPLPSYNHSASLVASCPQATVVGVDAQWASTTGTRTLDLAGPDLGDATKWHVTGTSSNTGDVLTVTARCAPFATPSAKMGYASSTTGTATATCPAGTRVLNGGAYTSVTGYYSFASSDTAYLWASSATRKAWTASVHWGTTGRSLTVVVTCVDTNVPAVTWTTKPPSSSNAATGQLEFSATDPFGQLVSTTCTLDGAPVSCQSAAPIGYGPLTEGWHVFNVDAVNTDAEHAVAAYGWMVDLTAPTVSATSPGTDASIGSSFVARFSEQVQGLNASSFQVVADATGQQVSGSVSTTVVTDGCPSGCTRATFTPTAPLLGHEGYTATLTSAAHDLAGNSLAPSSWQVQTVDASPNCQDAASGTTPVNTSMPLDLACTDADGDALTYAVVTPPAHGDVSTPSRSGAATYTPDPGYVGADSFTYDADDGFGGTSSVATVTLAVGPNHLPVCQDVAKPVPSGSAATVALDCDDVDAGQTLGYLIDTAPTHGSLGTLSGDGKIVYTPDGGYTGQDSFTYHATDGYGGASSIKTVTLYVATNAPPTCAGTTVSVKHATTATVPLSCTDPDTGQTLMLSIGIQPAHGTLSNLSATQATYTPKASFGGTDSFTYTASDGHGATSTPATVTLKVAPGSTALSLSARTLSLELGDKDRLTTRLRDTVTGRYLNGQKVLLQSRKGTSGSWSTLTSATTQTVGTKAGCAVFTVKPNRTRYYRVVYRGAPAYLASVSTALRIRVTS
jgi:hypothetical protein